MTSLAFVVQPDQVCIAMDTLVVGHPDKKPLQFQRKFTILEKASVVIAGTGLGNMIEAWFEKTSQSPELTDHDTIKNLAPLLLQRTAARVEGHEHSTTSLFHFGWSKSANKYSGFVCRPDSDWSCTPIPENKIRMQPEVVIDQTVPFALPGSFVDILLRQQITDKKKAVQDRQGIGGEIDFVYMHNQTIHVEVVGTFPTFAEESAYLRRD